ncbi:MAG: hypothetical protein K9H14_07430 [Actinomycetia bacterium]|nr:hypothetical protein [Actinomycetes bacterium]
MDISAIKKKINLLEQQRKKTLAYLLNPQDMIEGSIYTAYKSCGNKRCRCAKGDLHGPFSYLSRKVEGKTKLTFIRKDDEDVVVKKAHNYRKYTRAMARLNKLDAKIYDNLKKIRKVKTKSYGKRES